MKKLLTWSAVHALHWALLYIAFAMQVEGALYVLKFAVWLLAPLSLTFAMDVSIKSTAALPRQPVRAFLTALQGWTTLGLFVWYGHIVTALAWGLVMFMRSFNRQEAQKLRSVAKGAPA